VAVDNGWWLAYVMGVGWVLEECRHAVVNKYGRRAKEKRISVCSIIEEELNARASDEKTNESVRK
jgi:hypothetical protein